MRKSWCMVALTLIAFCVAVAGASSAPKSKTHRSHTSCERTAFSWESHVVKAHAHFLLVASKSGDLDIAEGSVRLNIFARRDGRIALVKTDEWRSGCSQLTMGLHVYPGAHGYVLIAAVEINGVSTTGVAMVGIDKNGNARTLFEDMSWGHPEARLNHGILEVVEVWPVHLLEGIIDLKWKPTRAYAGHVLVERVFRLGKTGKYELYHTGVAVKEEKKLSRTEFWDMLKSRRVVEAGG